MDKITITADDGEKIELFVIEQTKVNGSDYLLVTESQDEDAEAEAYILKDTSTRDASEAVYEFVDDEDELNAVAGVFSEMIDDMDII